MRLSGCPDDVHWSRSKNGRVGKKERHKQNEWAVGFPARAVCDDDLLMLCGLASSDQFPDIILCTNS